MPVDRIRTELCLYPAYHETLAKKNSLMAKIYYDDDVDMKVLNGRKIGIVGYGNQGRAHALNIRDSGFGPGLLWMCSAIVLNQVGPMPNWHRPQIDIKSFTHNFASHTTVTSQAIHLL